MSALQGTNLAKPWLVSLKPFCLRARRESSAATCVSQGIEFTHELPVCLESSFAEGWALLSVSPHFTSQI